MSRSELIYSMNVGTNMPIIEQQDIVYAQWAVDSSRSFQNLAIQALSDLSCGYRLLLIQSMRDFAKAS